MQPEPRDEIVTLPNEVGTRPTSFRRFFTHPLAAFFLGCFVAIFGEYLFAFDFTKPCFVLRAFLFPACLVAMCYPLTSYRKTMLITLYGAIGYWLSLELSWYFFNASSMRRFITWYSVVITLVGEFIFLGIFTLPATWIRRRFYPVYPEGSCQKCGYLLRGLSSRICPECGTPFH